MSIVVAFATAGCTRKGGGGGASGNPSGGGVSGAPSGAAPGTSSPAGKGSPKRGSGSTAKAKNVPAAVNRIIDRAHAASGGRTVLGTRVDCATFVPRMENPPSAQVFCVRKDGVLAYASMVDKQVVELTGLKTSVNASDLVPPR